MVVDEVEAGGVDAEEAAGATFGAVTEGVGELFETMRSTLKRPERDCWDGGDDASVVVFF